MPLGFAVILPIEPARARIPCSGAVGALEQSTKLWATNLSLSFQNISFLVSDTVTDKNGNPRFPSTVREEGGRKLCKITCEITD